MTHVTTSSLSMNNYVSTTLSAPVSTSDTVIYLTAVPTASEGFLEIDEGTSSKEIIYYTSKGASFVTCPDATAGSGRGVGGTTPAAHLTGAVVKQKINAEYWKALQLGEAFSFTGKVLSQANAGLSGGTMYYINLGGIKLLWGLGATVSSPAFGAFTYPTSFFSTIQSVQLTTQAIAGTGTVNNLSNAITSSNTSAVTFAMGYTTTNSDATVKTHVFVIGT